MCLAKVYLKGDDQRELLLDNVALVDISDGKVSITSILKEVKEVKATVEKIDFENSSLYLKSY